MSKCTHKSIAFALVGDAVSNDNGLLYVPVLIKVSLESLIRCVVRQPADKQLGECSVLVRYTSHYFYLTTVPQLK